VARGEVAPFILLVGDPGRAQRVADRFDEVGYHLEGREYVTITGSYRGIPISVVGTGIGCDNVEIAIMELLVCERHPTFLRIGTCGSLQESLSVGELAISTGAVRLENTSLGFVEQGFPALAHHEVVLALISAAEELGMAYQPGITATASGFYGWQGREMHGIQPRDPDLVDRLHRMNVLNMEMETSTIFTLASLAGLRAGTVCAVLANRVRGEAISADDKPDAEARAIETGLRALQILHAMDRIAAGKRFALKPADLDVTA
jgi:uridine phosphorylase